MSDTMQRERERAWARQQLGALFQAPERAYSIHYALQRLRRDETDTAPPVAAIALRNVGTGEARVFSIKAEADSAGIDLAGPITPSQMLGLEYTLLFNLNEFLFRHRDRLFVHWYMRDERFGFQALETRFRKAVVALFESFHGSRNVASAGAFGYGSGPALFPVQVPTANRIDLALVLRQLYDIGPVGLRDLAAGNGLSHAEMIEGSLEPRAFETGNHAHLARSTATKARLIAELAALAGQETIRPARQHVPPRKDDGTLRIFINYRREDTQLAANWLHEKLSEQFGDDNVFIDTDDIPAGLDFEQFLRNQIDGCDVFVAMIGSVWATAADQDGRHRLANSRDFVRREILAALSRGIPVIPVLVDGTQMPTEMQLPADLVPLLRRQSVELRSREFGQDVERLVAKLREAHRLTTRPTGTGASRGAGAI